MLIARLDALGREGGALAGVARRAGIKAFERSQLQHASVE